LWQGAAKVPRGPAGDQPSRRGKYAPWRHWRATKPKKACRRRKPKVGNKVEALLRFSTVADAERDFAPKLYADEGDWDLIGQCPGVAIVLSAAI